MLTFPVDFFVRRLKPVTVSLLISSQFYAAAALAQDPLSLLPGGKEQDTVFYLSKGNVESFKEVLVAPLSEWIGDGRMVASVRRDLSFDWTLSTEWEGATTRAKETYQLDDRGNLSLKTAPSAVPGFPFGRAGVINSEADPIRRGSMILWNALHAVQTTRDSLYGLEFAWLSSQGVMRKASGFHFYVTDGAAESEAASVASKDAASSGDSPAVAGAPVTSLASSFGAVAPLSSAATNSPPPQSPILFRDVFKLLAPPVVGGFSVTTWRYLGEDDDQMWIHSPVLGRTRRVLGSNRSDPILGSALIPDDLFVFSGKPQQFAAKVLEEKVLLLPFAALKIAEMKPRALTKSAQLVDGAASSGDSASSSGLPAAATASSSIPAVNLATAKTDSADSAEQILTISELFSRRDNSAAFIMWNYETGRFPQAAAWLPTTMTFVPRRVWLVELEPKDPFYLTGKEILVVDQESMLPFYKLVYERNGGYKKTVFGAWALASDSSGAARLPFLAGLASVEHQSRVAAAITTDSVRTFLGRETKRSSDLRQQLRPAISSSSSAAATSSGTAASAGPEASPID